MEKEYFYDTGLECETVGGEIFWIPDCAGISPEDGQPENCCGRIAVTREIKGWFGRWTMPGYLDCTDWCFSSTKKELIKTLNSY